ncbi:hypothetical protein [Niastella yeongjuensis]|nr:hypothetical protein [Niastella yeongjuensis]
MENLYNRVKNPVDAWRNGASHGAQMDYNRANAIPDYIQAGLFKLKLNQALSGNGF